MPKKRKWTEVKIDKQPTSLSLKEYRKIIKDAEKRDPGNNFVASCKEFLKERKFLSDKQIEALKKTSKTREYSSSEYMDYNEYEDFGFDPGDFGF